MKKKYEKVLIMSLDNFITIIISVVGLIISFVIISGNDPYHTPESVYENKIPVDEKIERVIEGEDSCILLIVSEGAYRSEMVKKKGDTYREPILELECRKICKNKNENVALEIEHLTGSSDYYVSLYVFGTKKSDTVSVKTPFGNTCEVYRDRDRDREYVTEVYMYHLSEMPQDITMEVNDEVIEWTSTKKQFFLC
ncbi:MAG: hypothetical protein PHR50_04145 [Lachnospiraceae bacterium]|nr:hypothetical protein [Lachnospiraceae bacterium]